MNDGKLHNKSDIAVSLAYRDNEILRLTEELKEAKSESESQARFIAETEEELRSIVKKCIPFVQVYVDCIQYRNDGPTEASVLLKELEDIRDDS